MSSIPSAIEEEEQINSLRLAICPKCGRIVKPNNQCECDILLHLLKKK